MLTMPAFISLAWRTLWRDLRAGELRLLMVAVCLAVAALTAVGFFSDRIQMGLQRDAAQLLGGDAVIASDSPLPVNFMTQAQRLGLRYVTMQSFPTMARADDALGGAAKLVALKAVALGYPLRGQLTVRLSGQGSEQLTREVPSAGEVWLDAELPASLNLQLGDVLLLGDSKLRISRILVNEPDRGGGFMNFAPRVLVNSVDLEATHLVQPASRVTYKLAVAARDQGSGASQAEVVKQFVTWAQLEIKKIGLRGMRVESLDSGNPEMRQTMARAEKFLNLVALLAALLSAVAVALVARGFAQQHLDDCAMLRVLGVSQAHMAASFTLEFTLVGLFASVLGVVLGYLVHFGFVFLLSNLLTVALPAPSLWPAALGMGVGMTLLFAFGLPPVLQLAQVPPLRVIRRDLGGLKPASLAVLGVGVLGFAALLMAVSRDGTLGLIAVGGFGVAVLLFGALSYLALITLRRNINEATAPRWLVLATRQVSARPAYTVVQISALAVGLLALVLLVLLRTDLVNSWRSATPVDAPNRFVINVLPEQATSFQQTLKDAGITKYDWYPMVRGRLVAINGKTVSLDDYAEDKAKRLLDREFNMSFSAVQPPHNALAAGAWQAEDANAISIEQGLAKTLNLHLGDTLRFDMSGVQRESKITSLRKVDWGSMRANFFALYPVSQMADMPVTYLAAFKAPQEVKADTSPTPNFDNALVRAYPNITAVDTSHTLRQVQAVLNQVIQAVEFLFGFTLAAGLVVLFAAVTATRDERMREFAIMRALGAKIRLLRQVQRAELLGVGLLAGLLASIVASIVGWALAHYVFEFEWQVSPWILLGGAVAGALLALSAGWWGLRQVSSQPVMVTLRAAG